MGIGVGAFAFSGTPGGDGAGPSAPLTTGTQPTQSAGGGADVSRAEWAKQANAVCRKLNDASAALGEATSREQLLELLPKGLDLADGALVELRALPAPKAQRASIERMATLFEGYTKTERNAVTALAAGDTATFASMTGRAFALNNRGNEIARSLGARACAAGGSEKSELARVLERHRVVVAVLYSPDAAVDRLAIREARAGANAVEAGFVAIDVYDAKEIASVAQAYPLRGAPAVIVFKRFGGAVTQIPGYADRETVAQAAENAAL